MLALCCLSRAQRLVRLCPPRASPPLCPSPTVCEPFLRLSPSRVSFRRPIHTPFTPHSDFLRLSPLGVLFRRPIHTPFTPHSYFLRLSPLGISFRRPPQGICCDPHRRKVRHARERRRAAATLTWVGAGCGQGWGRVWTRRGQGVDRVCTGLGSCTATQLHWCTATLPHCYTTTHQPRRPPRQRPQQTRARSLAWRRSRRRARRRRRLHGHRLGQRRRRGWGGVVGSMRAGGAWAASRLHPLLHGRRPASSMDRPTWRPRGPS